ncbi:YigZ family protein [uncultured Apibacter sp.]|uniref:YigZ family protein n=1 Tax=uncultured Apibacter sp. TaxID=1778616 RepID=UPI0025F23504|nr:YigZ family protein [uncultured Apibacter sp.]
MSDKFIYKTIDSEITDALLKIKGSKFYGLLFNVSNEQEIKNYLQYSQELYPNATHYCYAYRLGISGELYRANDDGEPSGTAGLPIYNQLLSSELTNVILIVVRYFGGTKLGVGGLIKAYKESAQHTIESAKIIIRELSEKYELTFDYTHQSSVMTLLKKLNIDILNSNFYEKCNLCIEIPMKKKNLFFEKFDSHIAQHFVSINMIP